MKKQLFFNFILVGLFLLGFSSISSVTAQANSDNQQHDANQTHLNLNHDKVPGNFESIDNILGSGSRSGTVLWDQYDTDFSNAYSNAATGAFGNQRDLLDDFEVPEGQVWYLTGLNSLQLWSNSSPGSGTDFYLEFLTDNAGVPGTLIETASTASYTEAATGRTFLSYPESEVEYGFDPIVLNPGTYWIRGHIIGPVNSWWMVRSAALVWGSECWVDYTDFSGLQTGTYQFGVPADLAFQLCGETEAPVPLSNWALGIGIFLIVAATMFRVRRYF